MFTDIVSDYSYSASVQCSIITSSLPVFQMHNLQQREEAPQAVQLHQEHQVPMMAVLLEVQEEVVG